MNNKLHNPQREELKIKKYQEFASAEKLQKPEWLKIKIPIKNGAFAGTKEILKNGGLATVCEQAACPNISECFHHRRATFLIMGSICTRRCPFCDIAHGYPKPLDPDEPKKVAEAARKLGLKYVVITSVDRDDIKDGGAEHFANCVNEIHKIDGVKVEILVPDFRGRLDKVLENLQHASPDVFNHNIETVPRLYKEARPGGNYEHSLKLLNEWSKCSQTCLTKSGLMVGLGEKDEEIYEVMEDLRRNNVTMLTIGQYLRPSKHHIPVKRYVHPDQFKKYAEKAKELGFLSCLSGPFVRSSYNAYEQHDLLFDDNKNT